MGRKIMVLSSVPLRLISEFLPIYCTVNYQFRGTGCLHLLGCKHSVNVVGYTDNLQERPTKGHRKHKQVWASGKSALEMYISQQEERRRVLSVSVYCDSNSHI